MNLPGLNYDTRYPEKSCQLGFWTKKAPKSTKTINDVDFLQFEVNFLSLIIFFYKIFEKIRKYSLRTPEIKKQNKKFQPKNTKNKKKISKNRLKLKKLKKT